jgi:Zinc finger found in FPG and IleRS
MLIHCLLWISIC